MSQETLSACMDGDLADSGADMHATLDAVCGDPDARAAWSRYHLIGDAMRARTPCRFADGAFADRVMAAIADETVAPSSTVVPLRRRKPGAPARAGRFGLGRRATGWAVAASVAAISLVTVGLLTGPSPDDAPVIVKKDVPVGSPALAARGIQPAVQTTNAAATATAGAQPRQAAQSLQWSQIQPDAARQLNGYLINHSRYRAAPGVGGTLGFARVASVNGEASDTSED